MSRRTWRKRALPRTGAVPPEQAAGGVECGNKKPRPAPSGVYLKIESDRLTVAAFGRLERIEFDLGGLAHGGNMGSEVAVSVLPFGGRIGTG